MHIQCIDIYKKVKFSCKKHEIVYNTREVCGLESPYKVTNTDIQRCGIIHDFRQFFPYFIFSYTKPMTLSGLIKSLDWYRDQEVTFLVGKKEYKLDFVDSTLIEWKIAFWLKK